MNPMVDGWMGDDWFHNGAFRQQGMPYIYEQEATRKNDAKWWTSHFDDYDMFMQAGSAGELGRRRGLEQVGFWRKILEHPSYDAFWRDQAVDKILAAQPLQGAGDAGAQPLGPGGHLRRASPSTRRSSRRTPATTRSSWSWAPGTTASRSRDGSALGALRFGSDTALYFRREVLRPFLDQYLKDGAPKADVAAGHGVRDRHEHVAPPARLARRLRERLHGPSRRRSISRAGLKLGFDAAEAGRRRRSRSTSPIPPSPCRSARGPSSPSATATALTWPQWLVDDQREASGRPDVAGLRLRRR